MGPKKFETWILVLGLIVKQVYRLSYRRARKFLNEFFNINLHYTTLQKAAKRLPKNLWQSLLASTIQSKTVFLAAGDGTGFSRTYASRYYLQRIDRLTKTERHVQVISLIDIKKRKFLAVEIFAKPKHEARKIPNLHKQFPKIKTLILDKGFDAEWLHKYLNNKGTFSIIPVRKNCKRGKFRKFMKKYFDYSIYWQRNIIESLFSSIKKLFGTHLLSKNIKTQSSEIFCRLIAYNLGYYFLTFSTEPYK